jgi:TRAP-type C4-dicarboxylate transport system permease small subunit
MDVVTCSLRVVATWAARLAGLVVVAMAVLVTTDVVVRSLLGTTLLYGGVGELSGYALALVTVWGASLTLLNRSHIRIDTVQMILPRASIIFLDLIAAISFLLAMGLLTWTGWQTFARSLKLGSRSMTPLATMLAIPQGLWIAGLVLLTITSAWLVVRAIYLVGSGRANEARPLIGTRLVSEEIEDQRAGSGKEGSHA